MDSGSSAAATTDSSVDMAQGSSIVPIFPLELVSEVFDHIHQLSIDTDLDADEIAPFGPHPDEGAGPSRLDRADRVRLLDQAALVELRDDAGRLAGGVVPGAVSSSSSSSESGLKRPL